jgi:hypothetical protein
MSRFKVTTPPTHFDDFDETSRLSLFDRDNPDKNLFNLVDDELIKLAGSQILVYKYIPSNDVDDVYMEARQKPIAPEPIKVYASYDPRPIEENLTQFGVEIQSDQIFTFNKSYIERRIGRSIIIGDVLKPVFQNMKFEVYQVVEDSFESYGVYHLMVYAKLLRDTEEIHNETFYDTTDKQGGIL